MPSHIRTWQVIVLQLATGSLSALLLAFVLHYPDTARRPEPQSGKFLVVFFLFLSGAVLTLLAAGVRSANANTGAVITSTIAVWLVGSYALVLIWINTYGT